MSRSYKHTPCYKPTNIRGMKRIANHKVRKKLKNSEFLLKGNSYRKLTCSWDICEYCYIETQSFEKYYIRQVAHWRLRADIGFKFLEDTDKPPEKNKVWKEYCRLFKRK